MAMERVVFVVRGKRNDYWRYTLYSWMLEVKDVLESEYDVAVEVLLEDSDIPLPIICDDRGNVVVSGVPSEEGYLIELLKKHLDRVLGRS